MPFAVGKIWGQTFKNHFKRMPAPADNSGTDGKDQNK